MYTEGIRYCSALEYIDIRPRVALDEGIPIMFLHCRNADPLQFKWVGIGVRISGRA